jgi:predicted nucleic acid-binding protein
LIWHGNAPSHFCTAVILLAELAEVIARDKFAQILLAGLSAADLVQDQRALCVIVEPEARSAPVVAIPIDHVRACAIAARADLIVTRDLDLLDLKTFRDIPILAAADALRRLEAQRKSVAASRTL